MAELTDDGKIPSLRPEPERDRYGRYVLPHPDGGRGAYSRATTIVNTLKDLNGLITWKQRMTAVGLARTPAAGTQLLHINDAIEAAGKDYRQAKPFKEAMAFMVDKLAHDGGAGRGASAGTEAHTLTEWADAGRLDEVARLATDEQMQDLRAYLDAVNGAGIRRPVEYIERIVINTQVESAGTFDRLVWMPDGRLVVADLKSQQTLDYGFLEVACQLAQYANADWLVDGQTLLPMPREVDKRTGLVMHAPVGGGRCDLYEIDLEAGWQAALTAHKVRQLRKQSKTFGRPYVPSGTSTDPTGPDDAHLFHLIASATHRESLAALWRERIASGRPWTPEMTDASRQRTAQLAAAASTEAPTA